MKKVIDFLAGLAANNNREWFMQNKPQYLKAKSIFDSFVTDLISGIREFDDSIGALQPKDCTFRIYRDVRFSKDKSPYKTHMGAFIAPGGKKSGYSGYYFQIGCEDNGYDSGCMLATGNYYVEPRVLSILREDISLDTENEFGAIVARAKGFELDTSLSLKRVPVGYDATPANEEYLKLKNFCLVKGPGLKYMSSADLLNRAIDDFKLTQPFLHFINRAIEYSNES